MKLDPVHRRYHHDKMTFGMLYNYTENFVLPPPTMKWCTAKIDSRPHAGRCTAEVRQPARLLRLAVRLPGKKLLFMGNEFAQGASGTMTLASTGICWRAATTGTTASSGWCAT